MWGVEVVFMVDGLVVKNSCSFWDCGRMPQVYGVLFW